MDKRIKFLGAIVINAIMVLDVFSGVDVHTQVPKKWEEIVSSYVSYSSKSTSASGGLYWTTSESNVEMQKSLVNSVDMNCPTALNESHIIPAGYSFNVYDTENLASFSTNGITITNGGQVKMEVRWEELPGKGWILVGGGISVSGNYNTNINSPFYSVEVTITDTSGFNWAVPNNGEGGLFSGHNSFLNYYTTMTVKVIERFGPWLLPDGQYQWEVGWAKWTFDVDMEA